MSPRIQELIPTAVVATQEAETATSDAVQGRVVQDSHEVAMGKLATRWHHGVTLSSAGLRIDRLIDSGKWSAVYLVDDRESKEKLALKAVPIQGALAQAALGTIALLKDLQHPHIIAHRDHFVHSVYGTKFFCITMEYCRKGTLEEFILNKQLSDVSTGTVCDWMLQLASALVYIHDKGVVHGDVRAANVLRDGANQLKLTGFASTVAVPRNETPTITGGCRTYAPPEWANSVLSHRPLPSFEMPLASYDMWGFGCVLAELATLRLVTNRLNPGRALASAPIALEATRAGLESTHNGLFAPLGNSLMAIDPEARATASDAVNALQELQTQLGGPTLHRSFRMMLSSWRM